MSGVPLPYAPYPPTLPRTVCAPDHCSSACSSIVREHRRWAALMLQRHWRGILCRLDRREQREQRDAARIILRAWRRFYFRQGPGHKPVRVADVAGHAVTLQTATRAWLARRRVHKLRRVTRFLAESQAACEVRRASATGLARCGGGLCTRSPSPPLSAGVAFPRHLEPLTR